MKRTSSKRFLQWSLILLFCAGWLPPRAAADGNPDDPNPVYFEPRKVDASKSLQPRFDWRGATRESFLMLTVQNSFRLTQEKTRSELGGPFFRDYGRSVKGLGSWRDGDGWFTNYMAHPMQGAAAGFIQIQNDPRYQGVEWGDKGYWKSRMRALAWSAAYSAQFELGPYSEATIGNVGARPGTMGYVDLVMTPLGGLGLIIAEDFLAHHFIQRSYDRGERSLPKRVVHMLLSPARTFARTMRFERPWYRGPRSQETAQQSTELDGN